MKWLLPRISLSISFRMVRKTSPNLVFRDVDAAGTTAWCAKRASPSPSAWP